MTPEEAIVIGGIISAVALVVGYIASFVREVVVEGKRSEREKATRREERFARRDERQQAYLAEIQENLAKFARAWGTIHSAHIRASRDAGKWKLVLAEPEASEADLAARVRVSLLRARVLDEEARDVIGEAIRIDHSLALPSSLDEAQAAMMAMMERLEAAHERIGDVLRSLEPR